MPNMLSQLKLQNIFDRDIDKFEPCPHAAWAVIFSVWVGLMALALIVHFYLYAYMRDDQSFKSNGISVEADAARLNRNGLAEVISMLEAKNSRFQALLAPSLKENNISDTIIGQVSPGSHGMVISGKGSTTDSTSR